MPGAGTDPMLVGVEAATIGVLGAELVGVVMVVCMEIVGASGCEAVWSAMFHITGVSTENMTFKSVVTTQHRLASLSGDGF